MNEGGKEGWEKTYDTGGTEKARGPVVLAVHAVGGSLILPPLLEGLLLLVPPDLDGGLLAPLPDVILAESNVLVPALAVLNGLLTNVGHGFGAGH